MALLTQAPKGTQDILNCAPWQALEALLRDTAHCFGFREIRFPTFEHTELFERGVGDTTDVVQKEMYTFTDKGGRSLSLRPEGTASVCRAMLEHSLFAQALPQKVYYIAPNFRYEKPQAGRLREHHQFGIECFGPEGPDADAEVIDLAATYLRKLGLQGITLEINSIGCKQCRPVYHAALLDYLSRHELCGLCQTRAQRNPLRILDCKNPSCQKVAEHAPHSADHLCPDCADHFNGLKHNLDALEIDYTVNPTLVRGFDYYTRTVFEFKADALGAQNTVCGGGRYDGLIETLGGPPTPALGFGSGMERLLLTAEAQGLALGDGDAADVYIANVYADATIAQTLTHALRQLSVVAVRDTMGRSLKAQMKQADKLNCKFVLIVGDDEVANGTVQLKNMVDGTVTPCKLDAQALAAVVK